MSRTILVVGNCQIGGIAAALQWIFPSDQVSAVPFNPHVFKGDSGALANRIASADIVLGGDFVRVFLERQEATPRHFVTIPSLYFNAFHPDIVAAKVKSTGVRIPSRYHSAICLWAYSNGIEPSDASRLFTKRTFGMLGYLDRWDRSVAQMKAAFDACELDFDRFFLAAKREGAFMYTINHPKISLLKWISKLLAIRIGHDKSVWNKDILINDALGRVEIWPVYPEVAHELALPGSYTWFVERGRIVDGLIDYIEFAYDKYSTSGVSPDDIVMMGVNQAHYQSVLCSALRGE